jgi:hypothetical protein
MKELDAPKAGWASRRPAGPPDKVALAHIVDADGGRDDAENSYSEHAADPDFVRIEAAGRRFRSQYFRHLRRIAHRNRRTCRDEVRGQGTDRAREDPIQ